MTTLTNSLSAHLMQSLGWALVHFLWQGTALAALAAVALAACHRASTRYTLAVGALVVMLAAPVATFSFYWQASTSALDAAHFSAPISALLAAPRQAAPGKVPAAPTQIVPARKAPELFPLLVEAWLIGVAFFSLRSAGGFWLLERQRRRQSGPVSHRVLALCRSLQARLGLDRAIRYCECKWLETPAVVGWFRPIVFLPVSAITGLSESQLEAVIAHELAHIQRLDAFVNVFQIGVETLLFYHPAVWWLNQRIRAEREHCCDDVAVALCADAVEYARALTLMEEWRSAPTLVLAANGGPLSQRIVRLLGIKPAATARGKIGMTGSILCLAAALLAGNAFLNFAYPQALVHAGALSPVKDPASVQSQPTPKSQPGAQATSKAKPSAAQAATPNPQAAPTGSYIDDMKAAGLNDLTIDQLIALKIQGVTPAYVHEMAQAGLHPDADKLVALRVQDVTPEYIRDLHAAGLNPDMDMVIGMKVQDVTPAYIHEMSQLGLHPNEGEIIAMKVQDVTPEYVRAMQALGLKPSVEQLIGMKVQDVTPEYVKAMRATGMRDFNDKPDAYIGARVQDLTPDFVEKVMKHGFKDLDLDKLMELKRLDIFDSPASL